VRNWVGSTSPLSYVVFSRVERIRPTTIVAALSWKPPSDFEGGVEGLPGHERWDMGKATNGFLGTVIAGALAALIALTVVAGYRRIHDRSTAVRLTRDKIISVTASSNSRPDALEDCAIPANCQYTPEKMVDSDPNATAWFANEKANGPAWVAFEFDRSYRIDAIFIRPGWQTLDSQCLFKRNQRPRIVRFRSDRNETRTFELADGFEQFEVRLDLRASRLVLDIVSTYPGQPCYSDDGAGEAHFSPGISDVQFKARAA
jgi:hypothetical protein